MLKITRANEPIQKKAIKVLIYGNTGIGKTSIAQTAENPMTLDFNKGAYRSAFRKDILSDIDFESIANDYKGFADLLRENNTKTLIIDTADNLINSIGDYIVKNDPKMSQKKMQLQLYGNIQKDFKFFYNFIIGLGIDIVFICHQTTKKKGDNDYLCPQVTGGSYNVIMNDSDFIGYYYFENNKRIINFTPNADFEAKGNLEITQSIVPNFNVNPKFFAEEIARMKHSINNISEAQKEAVELVKTYSESIDKLSSLESVNQFYSDLGKHNLLAGIKSQVWTILTQKTSELNLTFDKDLKLFKPNEVTNG